MPDLFNYGLDDFMFPTTMGGMRETGMILESAALYSENDKAENGVLENAVDEYATASIRSDAMAAVLTWIENGEFTYETLDETVVAVADIDGDFELTDAEEELYGDIWNEVPNALLSLGADKSDVQELVNGPNDAADNAAARIGKLLSEKMESEEADDNSLIMGFAYGEDAILESVSYDTVLHGILESTFKRMKAVRDGEVTFVRKRTSGRVRLSAAQKSGLKIARRKSHTAGAELKRKKSMKKRANLGL